MPTQLLAILRNTFVEAIRQPIYVVLLLIGAAMVAFSPSFTAYTMEHGVDNVLLTELCIGSIAVITVLLAAFTATGALSEELENFTVLTVVSKPVPRPIFVLGKFLGVAAAISLAYYLLCLFVLLTVRHGVLSTASDHLDGPVLFFGIVAVALALILAAAGNYYFNHVFTSSFVILLTITLTIGTCFVMIFAKGFELQTPLAQLRADDFRMWHVLVGLFIIFQAMMVLTAVAIACSTRLGQIATLLICIGVALLGLTSHGISELVNDQLKISAALTPLESIVAIFASELPLHFKLLSGMAKLIYMIVPNFHFLWPADAITAGASFSLNHVTVLTFYSFCQIAAILCLAVILFQKRDVG